MNAPTTMPWPTEARPEPSDTGEVMEFIDEDRLGLPGERHSQLVHRLGGAGW
jgi:hypothetical protein